MPRFLSPKELAKAVGVSESSLKRWADEGLLHVSRTAGGHRRIALREAIRYIRKAGLPIVDPHALGLADLASAPSSSDASGIDAALAHALREGHAETVRGIVLSQYLAGRSVAALCDGPIAHALHDIGELWRHGPEGIFIEHRAVDLTVQALQHLRSLTPVPDPAGPVAIGGALEEDPYILPSLMVATVLGAAGWNTVNLGPDLPFSALFVAASINQPSLVWLSCSTTNAAAKHDRALHKAAHQFAKQNMKLLIGGRALDARRFQNTDDPLTYAATMVEGAAFAEGMRGAVAGFR